MKVGKAPESDEEGQRLLNKAVEIDDRLYSVADDNTIFEFRWSYANKFHGFERKDLQKDFVHLIFEKSVGN